MSDMIFAYGYDVEDSIPEIETLEKAERKLEELTTQWCEDHDVDLIEVANIKEDHFFRYGIDEEGSATYMLLEEPEIKNEYDQLMWELRLDMEMIDAASDDYKYSLMECDVESITASAREKLDRIYAIEHP